jgi:uncharacterized membrane protein YcaP (DUF421 family)
VEVWSWLGSLLGVGQAGNELAPSQVAARALVVYGFTLACVRLGHKRLLNRPSAFDVVLAIMLGSIAARAVNGSAELVPTLAAVATLIALHWLAAALSFHSSFAGRILKGTPRTLVADGRLLWSAMRRSHVSEHDIEEALRRFGLERVEEAESVVLERDGDLTVRSRARNPDAHHRQRRLD